jgi:tetratricopeptide (TPR) repeat protein
LAAVCGRFGDAALCKTMAQGNGLDADKPFEAGERVSIPFEELKGHDETLEILIGVHEARASLARGDYAAALAGLEAAHVGRPDDPAFAFELGATLYEAGDYAGAATAFAAAHGTAPEDEEIILYAALAAAEAGDAAGAKATLEGLTVSRPDFPYGLYVLGGILTADGEYVAGRHHLFKYLESADPPLTGRYAREMIKESARAEMAAAAAEASKKEGEGEKGPAREAGPE